jgi:hypothetical protein
MYRRDLEIFPIKKGLTAKLGTPGNKKRKNAIKSAKMSLGC